MAEVIEINDLDKLQPYASAWNELFRQTPRASFFQTFEWFSTFRKHFGQGRRMRVLIIRSGDAITGIVPLAVINEKHRVTDLRVLTYPLNDWGMWYGPLGQYQSASMFMALRHLRSTPRDWDMIDLRWCPEDSTHDATSRAMSAVGWRPERSVYQQSSVIRLAGTTWGEYFSQLKKKWRHEIRRQERNLHRQGEVEFVRCRPDSVAAGDGDPHWDIFEECLEVSRQSWQARSETGNTICHETVLPFIRDCHAHAARLGMVDMAILRVGGKPLAYQYNYVADGEVYGLRMGYAQQVREWGVGKVLLARFIQDSFERGDTLIDLGIGEFNFKSRFRNDVATSYRYSYHPWYAWRSQGVRISQWLRRQFVSEEAAPTKPAVAS